MQNKKESAYQVAIIGFGPVGATLAALLGQQGHQVVVLDKSRDIYPLPRAFALDHEAMRTFQQVGIASELGDHLSAYRPTLYLGADHQPIQHFDMGPEPYALGWAPSYTFNQPALETSLRSAVATMPNVDLRLGCEVASLQQNDPLTQLTVRGPDGEESIVHARYVVACDGGTSFTRKHLGLKLKSLDFDEPWIVIDMHVSDDKLPQLPATNIQHCNPERPCTYVIGPGGHRRWEFLLLDHEAEQRDVRPDTIWKLLSPWLQPHEATIWRAATYRFHAVVLQEWRRGAVLIAGDAAHQMPPFLAQGMCQGLRDASNLAWKLDWVLRGRATDALLDTYGEERGPQVEDITATVKRLGLIICERDPALARARDARLRAEQGGSVRPQVRQSLFPGIRTGLIRPADAAAGTPFPQPTGRLGDARGRLDDLLGPGFLLALRQAPAGGLPQAWRPALETLGANLISLEGEASGIATFQEANGVLHDWFNKHGCAAALVRPDHAVFGTTTDQSGITDLLHDAARRLRPVH